MPKKKRKPVVRGPQLKLKLGRAKRRAKGEPPRNARVRYIEPPHKVTGNPFVAFRASRELRAAFKRWCQEHETTMPAAFRAYMSKTTGIEIEADNGGE